MSDTQVAQKSIDELIASQLHENDSRGSFDDWPNETGGHDWTN